MPRNRMVRFGPETWIPLAYGLLAGAWIYGSDEMVATLASSVDQVRILSTLKGFLFVAVTSALLHFAMRWSLGKIRSAAREAQEAQVFADQVFSSVEDGIAVYGPDLRCRFWNPAMERLTGRDRTDALGLTPGELFPHLPDDALSEHLAAGLEGSPSATLAFDLPHPVPGVHLWVSHASTPLRDANGAVLGVIGHLRDITAWKVAEAERATREREFRELAESMPQIVWVCDAAGLNTYFNQTWVDYTGLTQEESRGHGWNRPFHPDDQEAAWEAWQVAVHQHGTYVLQCRLRRRDGAFRWFLIRGVPLIDKDGHILKWFGTCTDIHDIKSAKEKLLASEDRWQKAFRSAPMLMALSGLEDGRFIDVNDQFCRRTGFSREEVIGRTSVEIGYIQAEERARVAAEMIRFGRVENFEITTRTKDGHPLLWLMAGETLVFEGQQVLLSMAADITALREHEAQRRELEAQIQHLQRLESVGRLAGGISHDMNNLLAAINAIATLLKLRHPKDAHIQHDAELLLGTVVRGRDLVVSLRDFTRKELGASTELDLNALARNEAELLDRTSLKKVEVQLDLTESLPRVIGDASSISNALMNLCINACDALPQGGRITLSTRDLDHGFVELAVTDNGSGMPPEVLDRALEPFFTTKPKGKGTGLGLSQVNAMMKAHGGTLDIHSEPDKGTRIAMVFQAVATSGDSAASASAQTLPTRALSILLVDDEPLLRDMVGTLLEFLGHQVVTVAGGEAAVSRIQDGLAPDLAILDFNMPGMDGAQTLHALRGLRPDLAVLMTTGHADERLPALLKQYPNVRLLKKPFMLPELEETLAGWP